MEHFIKVITFLQIVLGTIISINADCNVCREQYNTACISSTEFQQCSNNTPFGIVNQCNPGYYCSIEGDCSESIDLAECNDCRECDESKTFACTGTKTFRLCLGNTTVSEIEGQCSEGLVCNVNYQQICVGGAATCSYRDDDITTTTTTTTTPSPTDNPAGFCTAIQVEGRYPVGTNAATTCHQYIHCLLINGVWYGPIYNCPGSTYYDSSKRICVSAVPSLCSSTVSSLSFHNILLA